MIPIRDDVPSRTYPFVNTTLIVLNVIAFLYEQTLDQENLVRLFHQLGVVPAAYFHDALRDSMGNVYTVSWADRIVPLFTTMFLHGGWLHVIGNMLYLYIFGDNVEDCVGHFRYLVFYTLCGLAASGAHIFSNPDSTVPTVGASGAVAGVLGAYLMLYPRAQVVAVLPIFIMLYVVRLPALFFLGIWFLEQFFLGAMSLGVQTAQTGGIAFLAHVGGFVAGAVLIWVFRKKRRRATTRDLWWQS